MAAMVESKKSAKAENYTAEQVAELVKAYTEVKDQSEAVINECIEGFAKRFAKSTRSIVMRLVRSGVYKKKQYVSKTGEKPEAKENIATAIGSILGMSEPDTASLAKANKKALQTIFNALANSKPLD